MNETIVKALINSKRATAKSLRDDDAYSGFGLHSVNTKALRLEAEADGMEEALELLTRP